MPALVAWLLEGIAVSLSSWVVQLLLTFGLSVVTYEVGGPALKSVLMGYFSAVPVDIAGWLGYMNVDKAMSMILSATVVSGLSRVSIRRRSGGSSS